MTESSILVFTMNFITLPDIGKRIPLLEVSSIELFTCAHWAPDGKSATCGGPLLSWHYNFRDFGSRQHILDEISCSGG